MNTYLIALCSFGLAAVGLRLVWTALQKKPEPARRDDTQKEALADTTTVEEPSVAEAESAVEASEAPVQTPSDEPDVNVSAAPEVETETSPVATSVCESPLAHREQNPEFWRPRGVVVGSVHALATRPCSGCKGYFCPSCCVEVEDKELGETLVLCKECDHTLKQAKAKAEALLPSDGCIECGVATELTCSWDTHIKVCEAHAIINGGLRYRPGSAGLRRSA